MHVVFYPREETEFRVSLTDLVRGKGDAPEGLERAARGAVLASSGLPSPLPLPVFPFSLSNQTSTPRKSNIYTPKMRPLPLRGDTQGVGQRRRAAAKS